MRWIDEARQDIRYAARGLRRNLRFTLVVVATLALGIGANATLFSVANGLLLQRIRVKDPDSLVRLRRAGPNDMVTNSSDYGYSKPDAMGRDVRTTFSHAIYQEFRSSNATLTDLFACAPLFRVIVAADGQAAVASGFISSGNFYQVLGVTARIGRTLVPDDDRPDAPPVAVISHKYWTSRFGTDPSSVGKRVSVNGVPVTIVGVLPPSFAGIQTAIGEPPDISLPLSLDRQVSIDRARLDQATNWWLQVGGRLKPGVTASQVQGNLAGVFQHSAKAGLDAYLSSLDDAARSTSVNRSRSAVPHFEVDSASRGMYDANATDVRSVAVLSGVVALLLLIVCANVANLLLVRTLGRQREMGVRISLGATRRRLMRQLIVESVLLASLGGAAAVIVGYWGRLLLPASLTRSTYLEWNVILFVAVVTLLSGALVGAVPAFRATRAHASAGLKGAGRGTTAGRSAASRSLLVVQVALSLVLLIGAGLFVKTLRNLRGVDPGFESTNLLLMRVDPQLVRYDAERTRALYDRLLSELSSVPGVNATVLSQPALLSGAVNSTSLFVRGRTDPATNVHRMIVSPGFFAAMGISLLEGRPLGENDRTDGPKVALINQTAARQIFPNASAVGQRFGHSLENNSQFEIVGVVGDVKYNSLRDAPPPTMYVPYQQADLRGVSFGVRTASDPMSVVASVREAVRRVDADIALTDISSQTSLIEQRFLQEKVLAQAYTVFAGLAVLLAGIGLFGVASYGVSRRTQEIGVRMALGARKGQIVQLVLGDSARMLALGALLGIGLSWAATRLIASMLYGVSTADPIALVGAASILLLTGLAAGFLPARRATEIDPMVALRDE
jgi:predicted permease